MVSEDQRLSLGQTLWYVPSSRRGTPHEAKIQGLGRKWATLDNGERINISTLLADGGQYFSPGRCYLSKEAYEAELAVCKAWNEFRNTVSRCYSPPEAVTLNQIHNAHRALFKGDPPP